MAVSKREQLGWSVAAAVLALIAPLLRWKTSQPLLAGNEPYAIALTLESLGVSRELSIALLIILPALALGIAVWFANRLLARWSERREILLVAVLSPALFAAGSAAPFAALSLAFTGGGLALWNRRGQLLRVVSWALFALALSLFVAHLLVEPFGHTFAGTLVEFGGIESYSLFALICAVAGAVLVWKNKSRTYLATVATVVPVLLSFVFPAVTVFGTAGVAIAAGLGLAHLRKRRWVFPLVRTLTAILFLCGFLFSAVSAIKSITDASPRDTLAAELAPLRYTLPSGLVLSHPQNAAWIAYWTGQPAASVSPATLELLWRSRNIDTTTALLTQANVSSIIITADMRNGLVWTEEDGLLFLLHNSKIFKSLPGGDSVEAWTVQPETP
jgi:hypothetical protein